MTSAWPFVATGLFLLTMPVFDLGFSVELCLAAAPASAAGPKLPRRVRSSFPASDSGLTEALTRSPKELLNSAASLMVSSASVPSMAVARASSKVRLVDCFPFPFKVGLPVSACACANN